MAKAYGRRPAPPRGTARARTLGACATCAAAAWERVPKGLRRELSLPRPTRLGAGMGLVLYLLIAGALLGHTLLQPGGSFPGYPGDAEQYMWYLGWLLHALRSGLNPFFTALFNYPQGMNLMWNTSILAEAAVLGPLTAFTGTAVAYNAWFLLNFLFAGLLGRLVLARLRLRQWLQLTGGALIALLPYMTTQALSHISLITTAPLLGLLLIATSVWRGGIRRPLPLGAAAGLLFALQFYTLIEPLVSACLVAALVCGFALFTARSGLERFLARLDRRFVVAFALTAGVLVAPGAYAMLFGPQRVFSPVQPPNIYVVDLLSLVWPTHAFLLHLPGPNPANIFTGNFAEDNGYLSIVGIALAVWAARRLWRRPLARVLFLTATAVTVLALGRNLHIAGFATPLPLPWLIFDQVPFLKDILPARLMLYADLALVALILLAVEDWLRRRTGQTPGAKPLWGLAALIALWLPALPFPNSPLPQATAALSPGTAVSQALAGQPTYVLTAAFPEVMQMLAQGGYGFPTANYYGHANNSAARNARVAAVQILLTPKLSPQTYASVIDSDLLQLGVTRLVFIPRRSYGVRFIPEVPLRLIEAAFGPPIAASSQGVLVWRVPRPGGPGPPQLPPGSESSETAQDAPSRPPHETYFVSRNSASPSRPPSRPRPDSL